RWHGLPSAPGAEVPPQAPPRPGPLFHGWTRAGASAPARAACDLVSDAGWGTTCTLGKGNPDGHLAKWTKKQALGTEMEGFGTKNSAFCVDCRAEFWSQRFGFCPRPRVFGTVGGFSVRIVVVPRGLGLRGDESVKHAHFIGRCHEGGLDLLQ